MGTEEESGREHGPALTIDVMIWYLDRRGLFSKSSSPSPNPDRTPLPSHFRVSHYTPWVHPWTMASLKNHRVVIASLFLPNTAILGESHPSTPELHAVPQLPPPTALKMPKPVAPQRTRTQPPLKSIVDDLTGKVRVVRTSLGLATSIHSLSV